MNESKLEKKIMQKIQNKEIEMKPKWTFWIKATSLRGVLLLSMLASAIIISITIYLVSTKTPLELWSYGDIGTQIFFEDFPYIWLIGSIILAASSGILLSKVEENYKKATKKIILITILLIIIATVFFSAVRIYFGLENYFNLI
jgi:hypothetical protein